VVFALVLYALFASSRSQERVQVRTQALLEHAIQQRLTSRAQAQALEIQRELDAPLQITADLARVNALLGLQNSSGSPLLSTSREELSNLVKETMAQNPKLLGNYIGWGPNAFDANDDVYAGPKEHGDDGTGRFIPWWFRNTDGSLGNDALGSIESETLLPPVCAKARTTSDLKKVKRPASFTLRPTMPALG
jgi:methyl-accepting chemotaxis protein